MIARKIGSLFNWITLGMFLGVIFVDVKWSTLAWSMLIMFISSFTIGYIEGAMPRWREEGFLFWSRND